MEDGVPFMEDGELGASPSAHSKVSTCGKLGLEKQIQRIQGIMSI